MCIYPKLMLNRKYIANKKNGGNPPPVTDERTRYVPVGCGKCIECMKQRSRGWQIRLTEEIRTDRTGKFVTMTFSEQSLMELEQAVHEKYKRQLEVMNKDLGTKLQYKEITGYELDNEIATIAVRRFLERWRKEYGRSVKHWLVTELGETNTERLHIHGIIWTNEPKDITEKIWKYGNLNKRDKDWRDNYCNEATVNYIVKYIHQTDENHKYYKPIVLTSAGIGKEYIKRPDIKKNTYKIGNTDETYRTRQGYKMAMPSYYRNKIYNEQEREQLWIEKLNKQERWVIGHKIDVSKNENDYNNMLSVAREKNRLLGYGNDEVNKENKAQEQIRRNIIRWTRIKKLEALQSNDMGAKKN
ncbi:MAG: replication initiator protein [Microviridae sp.]|nr:MAG: replication initiator protein [Microviridae sp.]